MMNKPFLVLIVAIMILMVAFVCVLVSNTEGSHDIELVHQVVRDGTLVDAVTPYKLPEKKHYWTKP